MSLNEAKNESTENLLPYCSVFEDSLDEKKLSRSLEEIIMTSKTEPLLSSHGGGEGSAQLAKRKTRRTSYQGSLSPMLQLQ